MRLFGNRPQPGEVDFSRQMEPATFPEIAANYLPDNVNVLFHFAPHTHAEHVEGTTQIMRETDVDILIPEMSDWTPSLLRCLRDMAKGKEAAYKWFTKSADYDVFGSYSSALADVIFKSYVQVGLIDNKPGEIEEPAAFFDIEASTVDEALGLVADNAVSEIELLRQRRDNIMVGNLGVVVTKLVNGNRYLAKKDEVSVLAVLGPGHLGIYNHLVRQEATSDNVSASSWRGGGHIDDSDMVATTLLLQQPQPTQSQQLLILLTTTVTVV